LKSQECWRIRECRRLSGVRSHRPMPGSSRPCNERVLHSPYRCQGGGIVRPPRAMERRMWAIKIEGGCEPWPGQPGRSNHGSTHQELNSCTISSRSKQIPAGGGEMGPCPNSSINRWRAPITAGRTMRKGSAQETRGLGRATAASTVRWTGAAEGCILEIGGLFASHAPTCSYLLQHAPIYSIT